MLLVKIADLSDSIFVNFYRNQADEIMPIRANELKKLKEDHQNSKVNDAFFSAQFKHYQFLVKCANRSFGEESRLSFLCCRL